MVMTPGAMVTDDHRTLIGLIYEARREHGKWPIYEYIDRVMDIKYEIELEELSKTLPAGLTTLPPAPYPASPGQEILITIAGAQYCPDAAADMALFFAVFRTMVGLSKSLMPTNVDSVPNPCLETDTLSATLKVAESDLKRVFEMASREPWVNGLTSVRDGALQVCAGNRLRQFRPARTMDEYLELRSGWLAQALSLSSQAPVARQSARPGSGERSTPVDHDKQWDVFVAHASADKESFARPLARSLVEAGLNVWFDEFELTVGDRLRRKIDEGLEKSEFGIVILSPAFFERDWPQTELDGLAQKEVAGRKVILPVRHGMTAEQVREKSLMLADRISVSSDRGMSEVVGELLRAMGRHQAIVGSQAQSAATSDGKSAHHVEVYRDVASLLRGDDIPAVNRKARQLGAHLRSAVNDWLASSPQMPTQISTAQQLEVWKDVYGPLLDATREPLLALTAAATAAIDAGDESLSAFTSELVSLFRAETNVSRPEGGAPQLLARLAAEMLEGRALALARWQALIEIARPKISDGVRVSNWVFLKSFIHPVMFATDGKWPGFLAMKILAEDDLNHELGIDADGASVAAAEANMLLGVVHFAKQQQLGRDTPYAWGFSATVAREVLHKVLANDQLMLVLAQLADESTDEFRLKFAERFSTLHRLVNRDRFDIGLSAESELLLHEISRGKPIRE